MRATILGTILLAAVSMNAAAATARAKNVAIDDAVTRTRLRLPAGAARAKTELVLRDIRFAAHPGTQFHVVLERPGDRTKRARVGTLSFYAPKAGVATSRTFDVTEELRAIAVSAGDVCVVFEATTGRGGANAESGFDARSKLTIGEVELRVSPRTP